jgi:hypothetical protein
VYRENESQRQRRHGALCMYDKLTRASRIAFSGILDGSLKSGRPLEFGSGAGEDSLLGLGSANSGSVGGRSRRCPSATRSATCLLLSG